MKKPIRLAALALALSLLSGCTLPSKDFFSWKIEPASSAAVSSAAVKAGPKAGACTAVEQRSDYKSLPSDQCRRLYEKLLDCAQDITDNKDENGYLMKTASLLTVKLSDDETRRTVMALLNDNPQLFWISNQYTYSFSLTGTTVQLFSRVSSQEREALQKKLDSVTDTILSKVSSADSELEREIKLFNALADRCTYDDAAFADKQQTNWQPYTAYGALVTGKAVCDGYSRAMQLLCSKAGLQSRLVNGNSKGASHIWNLISIDGKWYHFDATWMDGSLRTYDYFNVTDAVIKRDHTISPQNGDAADCNFALPAASSDNANYYKRCAVQVAALDSAARARIAEALVQAAQEKEVSLALHIDEKLEFGSTVQQLFNGGPYFFQSCVQDANGSLSAGEKLSYTAMQYSTCAAQNGISIQLAYASK